MSRLTERFHPDLATARIHRFTLSLVIREMQWRIRRRRGWQFFMERNAWFQRRAASLLSRYQPSTLNSQRILFAHSYAARRIFRSAKSLGWTTVLGQIDPGEEHHRVVQRAFAEWKNYGRAPVEPPAAYFAEWREECALADWVVVNSEWSREALARAGIQEKKLRIIPLAYEAENQPQAFCRVYPPQFDANRPLRVLFVGHAAVPKGLPALLEATSLLSESPLELRIAGLDGHGMPERFQKQPAIRWLGPLPRSGVMGQYREADVLVFPTLSDGFGMAQVEAQGWQLPIIASRFCGSVVRDGVNGILLPEVSSAAVAQALRSVAACPALLQEFARHASPGSQSALCRLAEDLLRLQPW